MKDLGTLGGAESNAIAINNNGQIVRSSTIASGLNHAFLLNPGGTMKDLGTLGGTESYALSINNSGQIVGRSTTVSGLNRAFLYSGGKMTDPGHTGGDRELGHWYQ